SGRADFQLNLRGFRIEPGEVEAILTGHRSVRQAVVVVREDQPGDTRLVAYLVAEPQTAHERVIAELQTQLRRTLPSPLVPSAMVVLEALPLTRSGKLDRSAL